MEDKPTLTLEDFLKEEEERAIERAKQRLVEATDPKEITRLKKTVMREQAIEAFMTRDLKPEEAALVLGVHVNTLKSMLKRGSLQGYRVGRRGDWRITRDALIAFKARGGDW